MPKIPSHILNDLITDRADIMRLVETKIKDKDTQHKIHGVVTHTHLILGLYGMWEDTKDGTILSYFALKDDRFYASALHKRFEIMGPSFQYIEQAAAGYKDNQLKTLYGPKFTEANKIAAEYGDVLKGIDYIGKYI